VEEDVITSLPVDIEAASKVIAQRRPAWVFFRSVGGVVVEACACDTNDEAEVCRKDYLGKPGSFQGWNVTTGAS
jgi:hypothetical protein